MKYLFYSNEQAIYRKGVIHMAVNADGPYLIAAVLCEKVLQEKDETVSIIRMVDRITLTTHDDIFL